MLKLLIPHRNYPLQQQRDTIRNNIWEKKKFHKQQKRKSNGNNKRNSFEVKQAKNDEHYLIFFFFFVFARIVYAIVIQSDRFIRLSGLNHFHNICEIVLY